MKTIFLAIALLTILVRVKTASDPFEDWKAKYHKKFATEAEDIARRAIFMRNKQEIDAHNADPLKTFIMELNQLAAYTEEENTQTLCRMRRTPNSSRLLVEFPQGLRRASAPSSLNWVDLGAVGPVQDQGKCGSCWAFAGVAALEANYQINKGTLLKFSEQYALDCTTKQWGCDGGLAEYVVDTVSKKGIVLQSEYATYSQSVGNCRVPASSTVYTMASSSTSSSKTSKAYTMYKTLNADQMKALLVKQPLMVGVYAANAWYKYKRGVLTSCGSFSDVNHAVLLVGYDADGNWIIKNSWGPKWGEAGYIRLDPQNFCGMDTSTSTINSVFV